MTRHDAASATCPCGNAIDRELCCGQYLGGSARAPDAEALMRSRYTAYTLRDEAYLLATWHPDTRPTTLDLGDQTDTKWLGLDIKRTASTGPDNATVEFVARYKLGGRAYRLHEVSRFVRVNDTWFYRDGDLQGQT